MLPIFVLALLVHAAFSLDIPCNDGQEIRSQALEDANEMIGNWTYIYHWDDQNKFPSNLHASSDDALNCPVIEIVPAGSDFVNAKKAECAGELVPFNWEDAKLKLNAPKIKEIEDCIIFKGEMETWMMVDCKKMFKIETRKVSDDVIVMINPEMARITEMMSRQPVRENELSCLVNNVDVGKGLNGIPLCF